MNIAMIIGHLCTQPEVRYTPSGTAVCDLRVAVNHRFRSKSGDSKEETVFMDVVCWDRLAELCAEFTRKGARVAVRGRLFQDSWETDGEKRYKVRIRADQVEFLDKVDKS